MAFRRLRILLGVAAVAAGTAWATGGPTALRRAGYLVLGVLPVALAGAGVLLLMMAAVPRGRLGGPLLLLVGGAAGLAIEFVPASPGWFRSAIPAALIVGGPMLSLGGRIAPSGDGRPVRMWHSFIWPVQEVVRGQAPAKLILRCVPGEIALDLSRAAFPGEDQLVLDITMLGGARPIDVSA